MTYKSAIIRASILGLMCIITMQIILMTVAPIIRNNEVYVAASLDKEHRLVTTMSPRLIFVGGSNLALGINCENVQSELGLHTINMGLHAGLGLKYPLKEAQAGIRAGDIIVLSIEHYLSGDSKKLIAQLIDVNPKARAYFTFSFFDAIRLYIQSFQRCLSGLFYKVLNINHVDQIYNRQGFTSNGDLITHYGKPKPKRLGDNTTFVARDYSSSIKEINQFINAAREKNARVFFTYPAFPVSAYRRNEKTLNYLSTQYRNQLVCPILGTPKTFVLPDQYFFDTLYHLDSIGVQKRTAIMVSIIKNALIKSSYKK